MLSAHRNLGGLFAGSKVGLLVDAWSEDGDEEKSRMWEEEIDPCLCTFRWVGSEPRLASTADGMPEGRFREGINLTRWYKSS